MLLIGACATLLVAWGLSRHRAAIRTAAIASASAVTQPAAPPGFAYNVLRLADGSTAQQAQGALVLIQAVEEDRTELLQTQGSVRYEVVPKATRRFVVRAGDVEVNVLGTIFRVDREPTEVTVRVERGRVEVTQLGRRVRLEAGEVIAFNVAGAVSDDLPSAQPSSGPQPVEGPRASPTAGTTSTQREPIVASPLELLDQADRARAAGDLDAAARRLHDLLRRYPDDARAALANFVLGRVESSRGSSEEAARAFGACVARRPGGALEEDALAQWARARSRSGDATGASSLAQRYLATYPSGIHRLAMEHLVVGN